MRRTPRIGVLGPGTATRPQRDLAAAVGALLAQRACVVVCGGLGGCMDAAARGARDAGGMVVGVLPGLEDGDAGPGVTLPLPTGLGEARNAVIVAASHAVIAIGGSPGTLSEIALALKLQRPVVALETWELRDPVAGAPPVLQARDPEHAVTLALRALDARDDDSKDRP